MRPFAVAEPPFQGRVRRSKSQRGSAPVVEVPRGITLSAAS